MKKFLIEFIALLLIIAASFMIITENSGESASESTEEMGEALIKSMEETKKEKMKLEQFLTKASQELNDNGYEQIGLSYTDESLTVQVKDQSFIDDNKVNIERIIHNVAEQINFHGFEVEFLNLANYVTFSEEDEKLRESTMKVYDEILNLLREAGYTYNSISMDPNKEVIIEIQGMENDLKMRKEMEELIGQTILSKLNMDLEVKIRKKSESAIRDQEWQPIFGAIREETEKKFEEYRGFAYSFHPEPLQIIIKTDMDTHKWFWKFNKKANQITEYVDKIIELKREELSIEEIPYKIIIRNNKND
ncbi:hypothetical protein ACTHOQ_16735 [Solibacillus silvestris]|uniref:hypothetical protein n=1 Tax=Solibacillus silvestris TaxID=76853 RepID=UPI003F820018